MDPCGTPAVINFHNDATPLMQTRCCLLDKYSLNQPIIFSEIPMLRNLNKRPLCQTQSNALLMSQNTIRISLFSSRAFQNS